MAIIKKYFNLKLETCRKRQAQCFYCELSLDFEKIQEHMSFCGKICTATTFVVVFVAIVVGIQKIKLFSRLKNRAMQQVSKVHTGQRSGAARCAKLQLSRSEGGREKARSH